MLMRQQKYCLEAPKGTCPYCGEIKSVANMTQHKRRCAMGNYRMYMLHKEQKNTKEEKEKMRIKDN